MFECNYLYTICIELVWHFFLNWIVKIWYDIMRDFITCVWINTYRKVRSAHSRMMHLRMHWNCLLWLSSRDFPYTIETINYHWQPTIIYKTNAHYLRAPVRIAIPWQRLKFHFYIQHRAQGCLVRKKKQVCLNSPISQFVIHWKQIETALSGNMLLLWSWFSSFSSHLNITLAGVCTTCTCFACFTFQFAG